MARPVQKIDYRLLAKVSELYYEQELSQREIADKLHLSRPKVSRLLSQAREEGIVQISIIGVAGGYTDLEAQLEKKYGLREVIIVEVDERDSQEAVSREVGNAAAAYLQRTHREGNIIGISWGTSLNAMANAMAPSDVPDTQVVQLIGGLGAPEAEVHATALCRRLAHLLNSKLTLIPTPGIVDSQEAKSILLTDRYVRAAWDLFPRLDVVFVGIGAPTPTSVLMRDGTILTSAELAHLEELGAVGDMALRFFDEQGKPVRSDIDERVLGISLDQLGKLDHVVGVAGGPQKLRAIRGALAGGWVNVLITDQLTAQSLLQKTPAGSSPVHSMAVEQAA